MTEKKDSDMSALFFRVVTLGALVGMTLMVSGRLELQTREIERQTKAMMCIEIWDLGEFPEECEELLSDD